MAYWEGVGSKKKEVQVQFDGINTGLPAMKIKDSELTYLRNMDSREWPSITVRPPRSTYGLVNSTTVNALGQRNNQYLHVVEGNTWKYWNPSTNAYVNLTTTLSSTEAEIGEFATGTNRYTLLMNSTQKLIWDGTSTALVLGTSDTPLTKIFAVHKGRIYAARDNDIKYCALNKTTDWATANDAGSIDVTRAKGPIIAMCEYNDFVIVWTEYSMHELHGTGPYNYDLIDIEGGIGCISNRSVAVCRGRLYWLWYDGVYEYNGASPVKISDPVRHYIENIFSNSKTKCVVGSSGDYLYLAIPYGQNYINYSQQLDNAAWAVSGTSVVTPNTTVAPDGTTTADTLTDNDAAAFEYISQALTISNDSTSWTASVYIKKDTDVTRFPLFGLELSGGTAQRCYIQINTTTGDTVSVNSVGSVVIHPAVLINGYYRFAVTVTNNSTGNTNARVYLEPADGSTWGVRSNTATGSAIFWGVQLENKSSPSAYSRSRDAMLNNLILKYDTNKKIWHIETGSFSDFSLIANALYGVDSVGQIWNMRNLSVVEGIDSTTPISWEFITKPFNENAIAEKKTLTDMYLTADVSTGSTSFSVGYSTNVFNNDSTSFTSLSTMAGSSEMQNQRIQLPLTAIPNENWYRLRFAGTGKATIHYLQKNMRVRKR